MDKKQPEALRRSTAADGKTELFNFPGYPLMVRAVDFNRIHTESEMRRTALLDEMQKATPTAEQQAAPKAAPGEPSYSEKWDAELGRTAMRFADRAGDVHPGIDDAETICAEFHKAMSEVIERMPHVRRMTPPKAAPGAGNSGFDHQTAADFLSGKTVSDEAVRKFVQASRLAHDEKAALSAMLLSVRGVLASREAEIALLKKALLEAESAPQQEVQEPSKAYAWVYANKYGVESIPASKYWCTAMVSRHGGSMFPLYTAPQPAPAPLSESIDQVERELAIIGVVGAIDGHDVVRRESVLEIARRAALAAQGGK